MRQASGRLEQRWVRQYGNHPDCRATATRDLASGIKRPLTAKFTAARVRVGDGPVWGNNRHPPSKEVWLVGEWPTSGERKNYLSNLAPDTKLKALAAAIKAARV